MRSAVRRETMHGPVVRRRDEIQERKQADLAAGLLSTPLIVRGSGGFRLVLDRFVLKA
jgi:hypothetical protein